MPAKIAITRAPCCLFRLGFFDRSVEIDDAMRGGSRWLSRFLVGRQVARYSSKYFGECKLDSVVRGIWNVVTSR